MRIFLVQHLLKPFNNAAQLKGKPTPDMVFGGATGMGQDQYDMISDMFRPGSMGSSYFESHAFPNAIYYISQTRSDLRAFEVSVQAAPHKDLKKIYALGKGIKNFSKTAPVYVIARPNQLDEIKDFIQSEVEGKDQDLKRETDFQYCFFAPELEVSAKKKFNGKEIGGWMDIENHFMFFLDRDMFDKARAFFEIPGDVISDTPQPPKASHDRPPTPQG